jgi:excisionase family DNA binding protein
MKTAAATMPATLTPDDPNYTRARYDVRQAAAYLELSVPTLYRRLGERAIGHVKYGRGHNARIHFSQSDLDAFVARHRVPARVGDQVQLHRPSSARARRRVIGVPTERMFA